LASPFKKCSRFRVNGKGMFIYEKMIKQSKKYNVNEFRCKFKESKFLKNE
jgi:hypothetical protein